MSKKISLITKLIINKYNANFSEKQNEPIFKTNTNVEEKQLEFKKILLDIDKLNIQTKNTINKNDIICSEDNSKIEQKITDMNFVEDMDMVEQIVEYRKYEIRVQIMITNLLVEKYKFIIVNLLKLKQVKNNPNSNTNQIDTEIRKLEIYKNELRSYINMFINQNENLLKHTLCRYKFIQSNLLKVMDKQNNKK